MNTVEVLKRARNRIIRNGWTQGRYRDGVTGAYCALGAILGQFGGMAGPTTRAEKYLMGVIGGTTISIWNDTPGRLKGEVVLAFDQAIKNAKRRHVRGD